jgi:O-antigen ligase
MSVFDIKRVYWPSFFMTVNIILILIISIFDEYLFWFISTLIIFLLYLSVLKDQLLINPISILVITFISLLIFNMIIISPINNTDASYLIWLFTGAFLLFTNADEKLVRHAAYSLIATFVILSVWGLFQYTSGSAYLIYMGNRANAIFITPNSFAASINVILVPAIVFYLMGAKNNRALFYTLLILFSALLVTQSRGGWVAFISSIIFLSILIKTLSFKLDRLRLKNLIIGMIAVFAIYSTVTLTGLERINSEYSMNEDLNHIIRSDNLDSTLSHRFELYDIAWQLIKQKPLFGHGFYTYQYYKSRDLKPPYAGGVTRFVHNDYLQLWMEIGVLGVAAFVMLFIALVYFLFKLINKVTDTEKMIMLAIITGLSSFYVHALVDFVFYVPFLLFILSCSLGLFNQIVNKYYKPIYIINLYFKFIRFNILRVITGLVIICLLSPPAIAQMAYDEAVRRVQKLNIKDALPLYEIARQFAPYESDYYWDEGAVLMNAVKLNQHKLSADRADDLFSKGMKANFYAANNRLARAELHRDYGYLLANPKDLNDVLSWNKEALYWRPYDPIIQAEHLKTLVAMGEYKKVHNLLSYYLLLNPSSDILQVIKNEI